MPALEMAQETGKLISWLKQEGQSVVKGEPLLEIETDKTVMEIESPGDGILAGIKVQPGADVPVGRTIAWIVRAGEPIPTEDVATNTARRASTAPSASAPTSPATTAPSAPREPPKISPKARRLAKERGIDLAQIRGSGPDGEILAADISEGGKKSASVAEQGSAVSRLMAERTTQSWTTVPHFFVTREIDAGALTEEYKRLAPEIEKNHGVKLTYTDLLVALVARALTKHSRMNATWMSGSVQINSDINIGVAMAAQDGVVAPVIHRADKINLGEIAIRRRELTERTRAGKLQPADIAGGTFTISNLGMYDVDAFTAIIVPPQAAILAVGRISERVTAVDRQAVVRPMMTVTLSSDHRVVDGVGAAEFLRELADAIRVSKQNLK